MVRKALQWVTWSRRRLVTAAIVVIAVVGFAVTIAATGLVISFQGATPPPRQAPPSYSPGDLATSDPIWGRPSTPVPSVPGTSTTAGDGPEKVATAFMGVWLSGASRPHTAEAHAAWAAEAGQYGEAGLQSQLAATRLDEIPHATVTGVRVERLLQSANATVTLSTGRIVVVQLKANAGGWRVTGMHSGAS